MNAREEVLTRIRTALQDRPAPPPAARTYRGVGARAASLDLFADRVEDYRATVHRCSPDAVASVLGRLLRGQVVVPDGFPEEWLLHVDTVVRDDPRVDVVEL